MKKIFLSMVIAAAVCTSMVGCAKSSSNSVQNEEKTYKTISDEGNW